MAQYHVFSRLLNYLEVMLFQQHGTPPYYTVAVGQYLHRKLTNRCAGRAGPIPCPLRS